MRLETQIVSWYNNCAIVRYNIRGRKVDLKIIFPNSELVLSRVFRKRLRFKSQHRMWLIIHILGIVPQYMYTEE